MGKTKRVLLLLFAVSLAVMLAACGAKNKSGNNTAGNNTGNASSNQNGQASPVQSLKGKKIALIMQFNTGTFSAQYIAGVKEQVEKFGGTVTIFASDNDLSKMASNLDNAINQKFDGILIDHGNKQALQKGVEKALQQKIPVVAFDAALEIPGVTDLQQDDQKMAEMTLEKLAQDIGGKGNIVKVWVAGFAPMERRQVAYQEFLKKYPDIKEVAAFGNANNPQLDTQAQMESVLNKYPKGEIAAVWAAWDEFAKGAANAIKKAGRTEIKLYGIDMSDEDLRMIQDKTNPWLASAAVDPTDIGRVQVRYLYQLFHGDQIPAKVVLDPVLVTRDKLPEQTVTTADLSKYVQGWGSSKQGYVDWMKDLEK